MIKNLRADQSYFLTFERFGFVQGNSRNSDTARIACNEIGGYYSLLWMETREQIRNKTFDYTVPVQTVQSLKNIISKTDSLYSSYQRLAIIDCSLIDQVPAQLTAMVEKANECEGFIYADYSDETRPKSLAGSFLSYYFRSTSYHFFDIGGPLLENPPIDKMTFCGDKPWELDLVEGFERYILTAGQVSFCSWHFAQGKEIIDPYDFYTTIVFKMYDHFRNSFFEITLNACSLSWLERATQGKPLSFFRYLMIMESFDESFIKEYVYYTARGSYSEEGYTDYAIARLSFGYQLSPEYLAFADETGEQYSYH